MQNSVWEARWLFGYVVAIAALVGIMGLLAA